MEKKIKAYNNSQTNAEKESCNLLATEIKSVKLFLALSF